MLLAVFLAPISPVAGVREVEASLLQMDASRTKVASLKAGPRAPPEGAETLEAHWHPEDVAALWRAMGQAELASQEPFFVVLLEWHQACFFDNWMRAARQIATWRYPILVVEIGANTREICEGARASAGERGIMVHCLRHGALRLKTRANATARFGSEDFMNIGLVKIDVIEFAVRHGLRLAVSDVDLVFVRDPRDSMAPFLSSPHMVSMDDSQLNLNNLGILLANRLAYKDVLAWQGRVAAERKSKGRAWDNAVYNQLFPVRHGEQATVFPASQYLIGRDASTTGGETVAVHCFGVHDKVRCLEKFGLWRPSGLLEAVPGGACDYLGL